MLRHAGIFVCKTASGNSLDLIDERVPLETCFELYNFEIQRQKVFPVTTSFETHENFVLQSGSTACCMFWCEPGAVRMAALKATQTLNPKLMLSAELPCAVTGLVFTPTIWVHAWLFERAPDA